jgi:hypothetical protein
MSEDKKPDFPVLRQVFAECNGSKKRTLSVLRQAGYKITDKKFAVLIASDAKLTAIAHGEKVTLQEPAPEPTLEDGDRSAPPATQTEEALTLQDEENLSREGMSKAGMSDDMIEKFDGYAQFANHGFKKTVDATYGLMSKSGMRLDQRAEWIIDNVLQNDEEIVHQRWSEKDGQLITWTGPRYSDEEKLMWQKELTSIYEAIGKFGGIANQSALVRLKAIDAANGKNPDRRSNRLPRKGRLKNVTPASPSNVQVA